MKRLLFVMILLGSLAPAFAQSDSTQRAEAAAEVLLPADTAAAATDTMSGPVPAEALWDRANTAYINGDYHAAMEFYEELVARGLGSAKLYYNLGNAYFKDGLTGRAILYYHKALRLAPGNDDIRYNLSVAEARAKDRIEAIPDFFLTEWIRAVRRTMSCTAWSVLSLAALVLTLGLFLIYLLAQRLSLRKGGFYGTILAGVLFVLTTCFAAGERREMLDDSHAVVMAASTAVKSSPDKSSTDLFVLHEGTLVSITNRLEGWCEITIADGKKGWLEAKTIETI
ncbi:tetratricopeptide repeat protein [Alistipes sp.]|uniref:tetratricopeptide repeat protein n=1 Tax=Alistipes sp. TaxID=1872444 RepID=UPI0025C429C8|nr:tetratricopeptide repeat protein [Alistipes sp.]MCI7141185.1 tetratricopeptide repeat protein [Alistipes sp.]MDY5397168.1 tetratricopeptide repeat protein [Alistipes sp.]